MYGECTLVPCWMEASDQLHFTPKDGWTSPDIVVEKNPMLPGFEPCLSSHYTDWGITAPAECVNIFSPVVILWQCTGTPFRKFFLRRTQGEPLFPDIDITNTSHSLIEFRGHYPFWYPPTATPQFQQKQTRTTIPGQHSIYSLQNPPCKEHHTSYGKCYNLRLEAWVVGFTTSSREEVPGKWKPVIRKQ
jgi:hypothetical protein